MAPDIPLAMPVPGATWTGVRHITPKAIPLDVWTGLGMFLRQRWPEIEERALESIAFIDSDRPPEFVVHFTSYVEGSLSGGIQWEPIRVNTEVMCDMWIFRVGISHDYSFICVWPAIVSSSTN